MNSLKMILKCLKININNKHNNNYIMIKIINRNIYKIIFNLEIRTNHNYNRIYIIVN